MPGLAVSVDHRHHWLACVGVRLCRNAWLSIAGGHSGLGAWLAKLNLLRGRGVFGCDSDAAEAAEAAARPDHITGIANRLK